MLHLLLIVTAVLEGFTGLALLLAPAIPAFLLLGSQLDSPIGRTVGRVAGAALLALSVACWLTNPSSAYAVIVAMLLYNLVVVGVLLQARLTSIRAGVGLWPAVLLHSALAVWCIVCLVR